MATTPAQTGYAPVNGLTMYYEIHGTGNPLVLLHGGFGMTGMFGVLLPLLTESRQVIVADLQGHGRTPDIARPLRYEQLADDIAALIRHLGFEQADVMGYSLGGGVALRTAIQHPDLVRKLIVVSSPFSRNGWYPELLASMDQMGAASFEFMRVSPMYHGYISVAPDPEQFPALCDKMGDLLRQEYDWSDDVAALKLPTMLVYGDADSIPPSYAARFFELLGGGKVDGGWDESVISSARLAILPGTTHYNVFYAPALAPAVIPFLDAPVSQTV